MEKHDKNAPETQGGKLQKIVNDILAQRGGENKLQLFKGPLSVQWDPDAHVTPWGGFAYFVDFLNTSGIFDRLVADAPLRCSSPNAPKARDILGTILLSILCGQTRHLHMERLRHDRTCAQLLDMTKIVGNDSARRALKRGTWQEWNDWLLRHEREIAQALLQFEYVLDMDNSVKTIYGHRQGAELGYNPHKPGRPSHNYHTFFIGGLRRVLGVDVEPGSRHCGCCGMPSIYEFPDSLPREFWPRLFRGDVGYGTDDVMTGAEVRGIDCLFKIKRSATAQKMFREYENSPLWQDCGEGLQAIETEITLSGWHRKRRCFFVRKPARKKPAKKPRGRRKKNPMQAEFDFDGLLWESEAERIWDWYVLVTSMTDWDAAAISKLYRQRGDCENNFDEYKNQWGWCGFVTQKIQPCRIMARLIAPIANWWNAFCRLADGERHLESITSRPALLGIVGRITTSGRERCIHLTSTHAEASGIQESLSRVGLFLGRLGATARQLTFEETWTVVLTIAFRAFFWNRDVSPVTDGNQMLLRLSG